MFCCYSWNSNGMATLVINETCLGLYRYFPSTVHKVGNGVTLGSPSLPILPIFTENTWGKKAPKLLSVLKSQSWEKRSQNIGKPPLISKQILKPRPTCVSETWQSPGLTCHECNRDLACSIPSVSLHPKCLLYYHTEADPAVCLNKGNRLLRIQLRKAAHVFCFMVCWYEVHKLLLGALYTKCSSTINHRFTLLCSWQ